MLPCQECFRDTVKAAQVAEARMQATQRRETAPIAYNDRLFSMWM